MKLLEFYKIQALNFLDLFTAANFIKFTQWVEVKHCGKDWASVNFLLRPAG